ncbi:hypothetical protein Hanom_Chr08g00694521 [Helianthus anomalus]
MCVYIYTHIYIYTCVREGIMFTPLYSSQGRPEPAIWRRSGRCATALWGVIKGEAQ